MKKFTEVKLIPLIKEYENDIKLLIEESESLKYADNGVFKSNESCKTNIESWIKESEKSGYPNHFVVLLKDEFIGICGSPVINYDKNEHGFYFQLKKELWGLGLGTIIAEKLLNYTYVYDPHAIIYTNAVAINIPSAKILKKLGFVKTGEEFKLYNGLDVVRYRYETVA